MTGEPASGWYAWPAAVLALLLLNASLTFENVWPTPAITWGSALSIELAVLVLVLAIAHRSAAWLSRRVLPVVWVLLVAGRYLDVTAPGLYGREFNLYWDAPHLGNVAAMLARAAPPWAVVLSAAGASLFVVAAYVLARLAFTRIAAVLAGRHSRRVLGTLAALLIVLFTCRPLMEEFPATPAFADPVSGAYARQARLVAAMAGGGVMAPALGPSPDLDSNLERLDGADVLLIFVESYGAVAFETPAISAGLAAGRAHIAAAIRDTGRDVVSAYVESPTFGGSSWLAHLSLLAGVDVRDQYAYTSLMTSRRRTLVTNFAQRGYRTVALMPGMRQEWPEGAFYAFDVIYGSDLLEYEGPYFGWWTIPDQYALARLDALERARASRRPLFAVFPTSTTHAPFGPVPPYQEDWSRVLTGDAFDPADLERALATTPDYTDLRPSYVRAMAYEYTAFAGYLREHADDDMIVILLGDHQPPAAVAGTDASWSVPIHVIARNERVLHRLAGRGFQPGIEPRRPSIGPMHTLVPMLLDAFSHDRHEGANPAGPASGAMDRAQP